MRWLKACLLAGVLLFGGAPLALAAAPLPAPSADLSPAYGAVQSSPLNSFLQEVNRATAGKLPALDIGRVISSMAHGGGAYGPAQLVRGVWEIAAGDLVQESRLLGELLALGVVAALLELLAEGFERQEVSRFATAAVYLALAVLAIDAFYQAAQLVEQSVGLMVGLMQSMLPLVTMLLAGVGAFMTAGLFHPLMLVAINVIAAIVRGLVIPALIAGVVLEVIGQVSGFRLSGIATLLRQVGLWTTGAALTLFVGLIAVYGAAGPVMDGVALRSGKFLANTFIPVVGKLFSDAAEAVFGSTYLLKDAVGLIGLLGVGYLIVVPILKLLVLILVFRLSAGVLAPIGSKTIVDALSQFATSLAHLAVALGAVGVMFFLSMTIVFAAGKGAWG